MSCRRLAILAVCTLGMSSAPEQSFAAESNVPVWHWFSECAKGHKIELQVLLDGSPIYSSSFYVCPMLRSSIIPEPKQRILEFTLPTKAQQRLRTPAKVAVEGNIWEAGSESDSVLLGISFSTKDQVLLNTLHIAEMGRTSSSELVPGLIVKTSMAKAL